MNRRADAATAGDQKGPFLFFRSRASAADPPPRELYGTKAVGSAQVSNTRSKGSGNNLTYVLLGYFPDWIKTEPCFSLEISTRQRLVACPVFKELAVFQRFFRFTVQDSVQPRRPRRTDRIAA